MASSYSVELQFQPTPSVELPFNFVSKLNSADSLLSHQVALTVCWWELKIVLMSSIEILHAVVLTGPDLRGLIRSITRHMMNRE